MNIVSAEDDKRISMFLLQVLGEAGDQVRLANFSLRSIELYFSGSRIENLIKMMISLNKFNNWRFLIK